MNAMYAVGIFVAALLALLMAYAFLGLTLAEEREKIRLAVALSVGSVCGFALLVAILV